MVSKAKLVGLAIWIVSLFGWFCLAGWIELFPEPLADWIALIGLYIVILIALMGGGKK